MRVLLFSDIHNDTGSLRRLAETEAEWYVCAGDLVSWARGLDACGEILRPLGERLLVLPGNHEDATAIAAFAGRFGFQAVHGKSVELGGVRFGFLGYSNPTPFDTPGEYTEEEIARHLEALRKPAPEVLVCHCPPHGTALDRMRNGQHAGSTAIRKFVDEIQPRWFFSGHIHETEGVTETIGVTTGHNPGKRGYLLTLP
ncbi:MAG: metallophosphoesterase [Bryobacterales bacterium]|nr:metallophosphoesterase [Bryobacterales bacterium]